MTIELAVKVAEWAAAECDRQQSGELSVGWMVRGWEHAALRTALRHVAPTAQDILTLGRIVEPRKAADGFRRCGVRVGWDVKGPWEDVPRQIDLLCALLVDPKAAIEPGEWYRQYEEIHPFADGNGRTGSILYNWIRDTLMEPEAPPDYWAEADAERRRDVMIDLLTRDRNP